MTIFLFLLLVLALVAGVLGWTNSAKLNKKVAAIKKRMSQLESERLFLANQTTQLAEENLQLKSRLAALRAFEAESGRVPSNVGA